MQVTDFEYMCIYCSTISLNYCTFEYERMDYFEGEFRKSKVQKVLNKYLMLLRVFCSRRIHDFWSVDVDEARDGKLFVM